MNRQKVAVGPGASSLILIAVVLTLSVLTVLTMISARSDEGLAIRSTETRQEVYSLFADGEKSLARLDAVLVSCLKENPADAQAYLDSVRARLPEGMKLKKDQVSWNEKTGNRTLECAVRILEPGAEKRTEWTLHRLAAGEIWDDEGSEDFEDWEDWGSENEEVTEGEETPAEDGGAPSADSTQDNAGEEENK